MGGGAGGGWCGLRGCNWGVVSVGSGVGRNKRNKTHKPGIMLLLYCEDTSSFPSSSSSASSSAVGEAYKLKTLTSSSPGVDLTYVRAKSSLACSYVFG